MTRARQLLTSILQERIVNAKTPEEKRAWVSRLVPMVQASYAYIGGYKGRTDPDDIRAALEREAHDDGYWKISVRAGQPVAMRSYRYTPNGIKSNLTATDRSERGIKDLIDITTADVDMRDVHTEVSGRAEKFLTRAGYQVAPVDTVKRIFPAVEPDSEGSYDRMIGGRVLRKRMVGTPRFIARQKRTS